MAVRYSGYSGGAGRIWGDASVAIASTSAVVIEENLGGSGDGGGVDQIQSDWTQTNSLSAAYILNKPTIPAGQVQSDWSVTNQSSLAFINNKPAAAVQSDWSVSDQTSLAYIAHKPIVPAAQIQSDWNVTDITLPSFIVNKPTPLQGVPGPAGPQGDSGSDGDSTAATAASVASAASALGAAGAAASAAADAAAAAASAAAAEASAAAAEAADAGNGGDDLQDGEASTYCDFLAPLSSTYHLQHSPNILSGCTQGGRAPTVVSVPAVPNVSVATYTVLCPGTCTTLTDWLYCPATTQSGGSSGLRLGWDQSYTIRDSGAGQILMADYLRIIGQGFASTASSTVALPKTTAATTVITGYKLVLQDNVTITRSLLCPSIQASINVCAQTVTGIGMVQVGDPTISGRETNAGTIQYAGLSLGMDVIGAGTVAGERLVNLWDNAQVNGDLTVTGNLVVKGNATISNVTAGQGYTTLAGGFILQWGYFSYNPASGLGSSGNTVYITWPKAFTASCFSVQLTSGDNGAYANPPSPTLCVLGTTILGCSVIYRAVAATGQSFSGGSVYGYYQAIGI